MRHDAVTAVLPNIRWHGHVRTSWTWLSRVHHYEVCAEWPKGASGVLAALQGKALGGFLKSERSSARPWGSKIFKPLPGLPGERA